MASTPPDPDDDLDALSNTLTNLPITLSPAPAPTPAPPQILINTRLGPHHRPPFPPYHSPLAPQPAVQPTPRSSTIAQARQYLPTHPLLPTTTHRPIDSPSFVPPARGARVRLPGGLARHAFPFPVPEIQLPPSSFHTTFSHFPDLPAELRIKIWKYAFLNIPSRRVTLTPKLLGNTIPYLLHTSSESRVEALKVYTQVDLTTQNNAAQGVSGAILLADLEKDVLFLNFDTPFEVPGFTVGGKEVRDYVRGLPSVSEATVEIFRNAKKIGISLYAPTDPPGTRHPALNSDTHPLLGRLELFTLLPFLFPSIKSLELLLIAGEETQVLTEGEGVNKITSMEPEGTTFNQVYNPLFFSRDPVLGRKLDEAGLRIGMRSLLKEGLAGWRRDRRMALFRKKGEVLGKEDEAMRKGLELGEEVIEGLRVEVEREERWAGLEVQFWKLEQKVSGVRNGWVLE